MRSCTLTCGETHFSKHIYIYLPPPGNCIVVNVVIYTLACVPTYKFVCVLLVPEWGFVFPLSARKNEPDRLPFCCLVSASLESCNFPAKRAEHFPQQVGFAGQRSPRGNGVPGGDCIFSPHPSPPRRDVKEPQQQTVTPLHSHPGAICSGLFFFTRSQQVVRGMCPFVMWDVYCIN